MPQNVLISACCHPRQHSKGNSISIKVCWHRTILHWFVLFLSKSAYTGAEKNIWNWTRVCMLRKIPHKPPGINSTGWDLDSDYKTLGRFASSWSFFVCTFQADANHLTCWINFVHIADGFSSMEFFSSAASPSFSSTVMYFAAIGAKLIILSVPFFQEKITQIFFKFSTFKYQVDGKFPATFLSLHRS